MDNIFPKFLDIIGAYAKPLIRCSLVVLLTHLLLTNVAFPVNSGNDNAESPGDHYRLTRIESWIGVANFWIVDLDGDGNEDIFRLYDGFRTYQANRFVRKRVLGPALYQGNSLHYICEAAPMDIDTTPGTEIALIKRDTSGDSLWVEVYKGAEKVLLCNTKAIVGDNISKMIDHWDGAASECYAEDLDDDGTKEIILPVTVAYDLYPRGIYVYDYPSGELIWWFPLAGNPFPLVFGDANKDGFKEIYVKTFACCNGAVVGDLVDTLSYIHAIDHLGNLLWRQTLGDRFDLHTGEPLLCDCDGDGTLEIYYTIILSGEEFDQRVWTLQKCRARDNFFIDQLQFGAEQEYIRVYSADIEGDGSRRLLLDKNMCLIDPIELNLIKCGDVKNAIILEIEDFFDQDSRSEILYTSKDSIYIVDADMNIRGVYGRGTDGYFSKLEYVETQFGDHYVLGTAVIPMERSSSTMEVYNIELVSDVLPEDEDFSLWLLIIGIAIGVPLGGLISFVFLRNRRPRVPRKYSHAPQYDNLLTSLVNFNHGYMAGKNLNRLLFLFSNLPESPDKLEQIKPNIRAAMDAYHAHTASQLDHVAQYGTKLKSIQPVIKELIENKERLTDTLTEDLIFDLRTDDDDPRIPAIAESIGCIQSAILRVRKTVQLYFSADLLRVIPGVMIGIVSDLRRNGVGFRAIETRGGALRLVFFAEAELAAIFEELLSNACDAMADSSTKELAMTIDFGVDEAVIRLSDTGTGLRGADPEQPFRRDYSTKHKKGGYGLYHARQQVERFGGCIKMYDNADGPGVTVELTLKTVDHE